MNLKRLEKARKVVTTLVVAALGAALSYGISSLIVTHHPAFALTTNKQFTITETITPSYPTCSGAGTAKLNMGQTRCLVVTVKNPLSVAIKVNTFTMTVTSFTATPSNPVHSPACTTTMVTQETFTTPFTVTPAPHTTTVIDKPIKLKNTKTNQDNCENGTFHFRIHGTATYTDTTTTSLAPASPAPIYPGSTLTLTATVTPSNPKNDPYGPATAPVKVVKFYSCTNTTPATCTHPLATGTKPLTQKTTTTKAASASYTTGPLAAGTYYYEAVYPAKGTHTGTFTGSHSKVVTQVVSYATTCAPISTTGTTVTTVTGTYSGNYTVASGHTLYLDGGTVTGNVSIASGGKFIASHGTVNGNVTSSGGSVSLENSSKILGNGMTTSGGAVSIGAGSSVNGNVTASGSGPICIVGTTSSRVTVNGNVSVKTGPLSTMVDSFCALTTTGNLTYLDNKAPVQIGGSAGCPGDKISGHITVQSNTGKVTIGAGTATKAGPSATGNKATGGITVKSNKTGGGLLAGNWTSGTCTLSGDTPKITVPNSTSNYVTGTDTCKVSG